MTETAEELDARSRKSNMRLIGHCAIDDDSGGMHINLKDGYAYFGHMGNRGTSIIDVKDPRKPTLVGNIPAPPNTHSHKVQIVDDLMLLNRERLPPLYGGNREDAWVSGVSVFDISDPLEPRPLGFWSAGGRGVHRMTYWEHPYVFCSAGDPQYASSGSAAHGGRGEEDGLAILDVSDPTRPREVGRWWVPGMRYDERRTWSDEIVKFHHGIPRGDRLYCGWWDHGLVILDIADVSSPQLVSHLRFPRGESANTHTALPLPGRDLLVVTDECNVNEGEGLEFQVRIVDIADELRPKVVSHLPVPEGDYRNEGLRFGPHNVHEMRPGSHQDPNTVFLTYFNAGLRVFDVTDATQPREIAYHVPPAPPGKRAIQLNDLIVDGNGIVYVSDRYAGAMYVFEMT